MVGLWLGLRCAPAGWVQAWVKAEAQACADASGEEGPCGLHTAGPAPAPGHQGPVLGGPCEVHWHLAASQGRHPQR